MPSGRKEAQKAQERLTVAILLCFLCLFVAKIPSATMSGDGAAWLGTD
jgi:hypothetical protein